MTRRGRPNRRHVLASLGAGAAFVLGGCSDFTDGEPTYEDGDVPDVDGENRTAEEMATAEALAQQGVSDAVSPLDVLEIREHEFVHEDGYLGSTVQGVVENTGDERIEEVEVRVRVYDDEGAFLDRYLDSTGDLAGSTSWAFQVVLLESPGDVADYEIAVVGTPT